MNIFTDFDNCEKRILMSDKQRLNVFVSMKGQPLFDVRKTKCLNSSCKNTIGDMV